MRKIILILMIISSMVSIVWAIEGVNDKEIIFEFQSDPVIIWNKGDVAYLYLKVTNSGTKDKAVNIAYYPLGIKGIDAAGKSLPWSQKVENLKLKSTVHMINLKPNEHKVLTYNIKDLFKIEKAKGPFTFSFVNKTKISYDSELTPIKIGIKKSDNRISVTVIDKAGDYIIEDHFLNDEKPSIPIRKLKCKGKYVPISSEHICNMINAKYKNKNQTLDKILEHIVKLTNIESSKVLKSSADISGFKKQQLDKDLQEIKIGKTKTVKENRVIHILYTYTKIGGILKRYKVTCLNNFIEHCNIIDLGVDIGNAKYLE